MPIVSSYLGRMAEQVFSFFALAGTALVNTFSPPFRIRDTIRQIHFVAIESAPIVIICVGFAAVVVVIEASFHMKLVIHNDALVPGFAALLIIKEIGAVVSALLLTSRVGAGIAAEVGTMQITEQIDALRMLGINPIRYIVVPRFVAGVIGTGLLSLIATVFCLYFAMLVSQVKLAYSFGQFLTAMHAFVGFQDLIFAGIKGACFGAVIPIVSCFFGFRCQAGAEGVGRATTNSVVVSSVLIIVLDFVLSWFFAHF